MSRQLSPLRPPDKIRIGFVPLIDCAPFAVALEHGLFADRGLQVQLLRQPGWATVRDKVVMGEIDGAHAICGLAFATTYGLGCPPSPCSAALLLNTHSDGITLSQRLVEAGATTSSTVAALARERVGEKKRPLVFGVVHPYSTHHFLLRAWFQEGGIGVGEGVEIVTVPPPLMGKNLAAGHLDGFCVGEPWNTAAAAAGEGVCVASSAALSPEHPEKVFLVRESFERLRRDEHRAAVAALLEACAFCDDPANHAELAKILSAPRYLDLPETLISASLSGTNLPELSGSGARHFRFSGEAVNRPSSDKLNWVVNQLSSCGLTPKLKSLGTLADVFRPDIYDEVATPA